MRSFFPSLFIFVFAAVLLFSGLYVCEIGLKEVNALETSGVLSIEREEGNSFAVTFAGEKFYVDLSLLVELLVRYRESAFPGCNSPLGLCIMNW